MTCLTSIVEKTTYASYEIVIIENNSEQQETEAFYRDLESGKIPEYADLVRSERLRIVRYPGSFNYSAIHNFALPYTKGEYLLLLNNDTEVRSGGWIEELLGLCQQKDIGAVGAKLYYPDGTIQHAGVVIGLCGVASHLFIGASGDADGYAGRLKSVQDVSAVTAACMMTKRTVYEAVGGLTEELAVAYNDIDYCMKVRRAGYLVAFTPYAELTHYESKSRGLEDSKEKKDRLSREAGIFCRRWEKEIRTTARTFLLRRRTAHSENRESMSCIRTVSEENTAAVPGREKRYPDFREINEYESRFSRSEFVEKQPGKTAGGKQERTGNT